MIAMTASDHLKRYPENGISKRTIAVVFISLGYVSLWTRLAGSVSAMKLLMVQLITRWRTFDQGQNGSEPNGSERSSPNQILNRACCWWPNRQ